MPKRTKIIYDTNQSPVDIVSLDIMVLKNTKIKYPCRLSQFSISLDNNMLKEDSAVIDKVIAAANFNPLHQTFIKFTVSIINDEPLWYMHVFIIRQNASITVNSNLEFNKLVHNVTDRWIVPTQNEINNLDGYNKRLIKTLINQPIFQVKFSKKLRLETLAIEDGYVDLTDAIPPL